MQPKQVAQGGHLLLGTGNDAPGYGIVLEGLESRVAHGSLLVERLSEEHATVRVLDGSTTLEPGDLVRIVPNHACVVSNLVEEVRVVEGLTLVDSLRVAARGKIA